MMSFSISDDKFHEVYKWCASTFGDDNDTRGWYTIHDQWYCPAFIIMQDHNAVLFALKWS